MRIIKASKKLPVYLDGRFSIYVISYGDEDYSIAKLKKVKAGISYTELQVFDGTKNSYKASGIEVTRKIRTRPMRITENQYIKIGDQVYKVENAVTALNASGFLETDISMSNYTESYILEVE